MSDDLEKQIEERKAQARDKNFDFDANIIIFGLGTVTIADEHNHYTKNGYYSDENFDMQVNSFLEITAGGESAGMGVIIRYDGKLVYKSGGGDILSYVPGNWEDEFWALKGRATPLYQEKQREIEAQKNAKKAKEEKKEKDRWGL